MVLVNAATSGPDELVATVDRFTDDAARRSPIVLLAFEHSADAILRAWRSTIDSLPRDLVVVSVGEITRGTTVEPTPVEVGPATVLPVGTDDLTGIDMAVGRSVSALDDGAEPAIWIDSLTPLLEGTDLDQAVRFLRIFAGRVERANATAFCRFDEHGHESSTADAIEPLFDTTIALE